MNQANKFIVRDQKLIAEGFELPVWLYEYLIKESKLAKEKYNQKLAGAIENEFSLRSCLPWVKEWFMGQLITTDIYQEKIKNVQRFYLEAPQINCELKDLWVNFQKKHEYNPSHDHGGLFSMVIFMSIPYHIDDEKNFKNTKDSKTQENGCLNFQGRYSGGIAVPADKTWKGKGFFFDASQLHSVNPFYTSDEYRITISGNFYLI
jgi:hypothetical protein|tara:strand:+ start:43 stop:657 length:615 start_codon:yes stop_codon:yes gene_type:complete